MGVKEEEPGEDIEEVKAETEEVAVEDTRGRGVLVVTPWLRGEAGHAWRLSHANHRNVLTLPWVQGALDSGYSPDAPFFSAPEVAYVTMHWAFRRLLRHHIRHKGAGGGLAAHIGAWTWKPLPGKPRSPIAEPIGAEDLMQGKIFTGPRGALMRGSHWELCFLHWEEKGWVKLQHSGRKLDVPAAHLEM